MRALYAFSGDPVTYGHIDIVERAARTYDQVVVAIGENPHKSGSYTFTAAERLALANRSLAHIPNVSAVIFSGLLGEYAYREGFDVIVRGVRNNSDLEGELVLHAVVESLHDSLDMVFFPGRRQLSHISSGVVKAIVREGGDVSDYCPLGVKQELEKRLLNKFSVAVAGGVAAGKTTIAKALVERLSQHVTANYINLDQVGHHILGDSDDPIYRATRQRIGRRFGEHVLRDDTTIDRRVLGHIVFSDPHELEDLNDIMREPMLTRLYEETTRLPGGITIVEGAIIVEANWTSLFNNNIVLVDAPEDVRCQRLMDRNNLSEEDARNKISRQTNPAERRRMMDERIAEHRWGHVWNIDSSNGGDQLDTVVQDIIDLAKAPITE